VKNNSSAMTATTACHLVVPAATPHHVSPTTRSSSPTLGQRIADYGGSNNTITTT